MDVQKIASRLNAMYPSRDWDQQCQRLVWNIVWLESGVPESQMITYPTATAARLASNIVSTDPLAAPVGAIHYWLRPAEGHVAVSLGGGSVIMTGTPYALGSGGYQLGRNYGVTTVAAYTSRMGNPYLGWSHQNGKNPSIVSNSTPQSVKDIPMPALIQHPNSSIGFVSDAGLLDPISDMNEVNALLATVCKGQSIIKLPNPQIWNLLSARTKRVLEATAKAAL